MKRLVFCMMVLLAPGLLPAADGMDAVVKAVKDLGLKAGSARLCVLTNAALVDHRMVDAITAKTGCTAGKGNLILYRTPIKASLKIALFNGDTRELILLTRAGKGSFGRVKANISPVKTADEKEWKAIQSSLGEDKSVVGTLSAWADGAPYDLLKCLEIHGHFCPGVTSGYLLGKYIEKHYPLGDKQQYLYIGAPAWCKEDAVQYLLNLSAGSKSIIVRPIEKEEVAALSYKNPICILVVRDEYKGPGTARVLCFDWDKSPRKKSGERGGMKGNPLSWKDDPSIYITVPLETRIAADDITRLMNASNPYIELEAIVKNVK